MTPNIVTYTLPSAMTADSAEALTENLSQLPLSPKTHVALDASQVEHLTTSGVQILTALEKSLRQTEGVLEITGQPAFFTQALSDLGLEWLGKKLQA